MLCDFSHPSDMPRRRAVVIHVKVGCPYCHAAAKLLHDHDITFTEVQYDPSDKNYAERSKKLKALTGHNTFPQVFVNGNFIGGFTDLQDALRV